MTDFARFFRLATVQTPCQSAVIRVAVSRYVDADNQTFRQQILIFDREGQLLNHLPLYKEEASTLWYAGEIRYANLSHPVSQV